MEKQLLLRIKKLEQLVVDLYYQTKKQLGGSGQTLLEGKNINIISNEIEVAIPPIENTTSILGTTGSQPYSIARDLLGNTYTANRLSDNVTKITPDGTSSTLGTTGSQPIGIVVDSSGNVYTCNFGSDNVTKITSGGFSSVFASTINKPIAITIDSLNNIYTCSAVDDTVTKITPAGNPSIFASVGNEPRAITVDSAGNIYTANKLSSNITKITSVGTPSTLSIISPDPTDITVDSLGNVFTCHTNNTINRITSGGARSVFSTAVVFPYCITTDSLNNVYVGGALKVVKRTPTSVLTTISEDENVFDITVDSLGNIYYVNNSVDSVSKITIDNRRILGIDNNSNIIRVDKPIELNNSYSQTEALTGGTWIDGKPIYRKVIAFTVPGLLDAPAGVGIVHNLNIDKYLRADVTVNAPVGVTTEDAAWFFPITMARATSNVGIGSTGVIMLNRNNVTFEEAQSAITINDFLLILEYTKA
jgi:hypothetical protein